jgi:hypothetical protein
VKKDRQLISENDINRNGSLKKVFLRLSGKVRPELQSGSTKQSFEFVNRVTHQFLLSSKRITALMRTDAKSSAIEVGASGG